LQNIVRNANSIKSSVLHLCAAMYLLPAKHSVCFARSSREVEEFEQSKARGNTIRFYGYLRRDKNLHNLTSTTLFFSHPSIVTQLISNYVWTADWGIKYSRMDFLHINCKMICHKNVIWSCLAIWINYNYELSFLWLERRLIESNLENVERSYIVNVDENFQYYFYLFWIESWRFNKKCMLCILHKEKQ